MIKKGMSVKISNDRYPELTDITYGTVVEVNTNWANSVAVAIFNKRNPKSAKGYYYFDTDDVEENNDDINSLWPRTTLTTTPEAIKQYVNLRFGNKEDEEMNKMYIKGYKIAVCDKNAKFALYEDDVNVGDHVLVKNKFDGKEIIVTVCEIFKDQEVDDAALNGEVICKILYAAYEHRQERLRKICKIKKAMAKKRAELNELAVYKALAAQSPEMADMLKELEELL